MSLTSVNDVLDTIERGQRHTSLHTLERICQVTRPQHCYRECRCQRVSHLVDHERVSPSASSHLSSDPEIEYFGDGIAEEIINVLARLPGLRVAGRSSAFSFKGKHENLRVIGDKLAVGTVLEGSVRKAGAQLRITAQLVNVADGYDPWSERFDRGPEDVFAVQEEIARTT